MLEDILHDDDADKCLCVYTTERVWCMCIRI